MAAFLIVSRLKRSGVAPRTVIDVGANVGQFSVASSRLLHGATIHPIEPDPRVAVQLRKNVGSAVAPNLRIAAIGEHEGTATLNVNRDSQVSSLLQLGSDRLESFPQSTVISQIQVPLTTLDALFGGAELSAPILLKIDVQGFEDRVIAGAGRLLESVQWVLIEVAFSRLYAGERDFETIVGLLETHGFRFVRPMNFHVSPRTGEIIEMDALFECVRRPA
jgi:FkbM family methyltransferase